MSTDLVFSGVGAAVSGPFLPSLGEGDVELLTRSADEQVFGLHFYLGTVDIHPGLMCDSTCAIPPISISMEVKDWQPPQNPGAGGGQVPGRGLGGGPLWPVEGICPLSLWGQQSQCLSLLSRAILSRNLRPRTKCRVGTPDDFRGCPVMPLITLNPMTMKLFPWSPLPALWWHPEGLNTIGFQATGSARFSNIVLL